MKLCCFLILLYNVPHNGCLLKSTTGRDYIPADVITATDARGVILLQDADTNNFVNVVPVDSALLSKSKDGTSTSSFTQAYPHSSRCNHGLGITGKALGTFEGLKKHVSICIESSNAKCLIRKDNGIFTWSDSTIKAIESNKTPSEDVPDRQMKLVVGMLSLLLNLLVDKELNLAEGVGG